MRLHAAFSLKNEKKKCDGKCNDEVIRLFYGIQLYLINECIQKKQYEEIKDLISCATNDLIKNFTRRNSR